jgi:CubicO group peptidase (beta-lactamase class C family)
VVPGHELSHVRSESLKLIRRFLEEDLVPGLSIALVGSEGPIWVEGFGSANTETGEAVTAETVFRAGSVSKPITALLVMQMQQEGLIDIDSPLKSQLEGFSIKRHPTHSGVITPRHLLSHHGGLPSDLLKGMFTDRSFSQVSEQLSESYLASTPGTHFNYSNIGYDLLGMMLEQHARQTFEDYAFQRLSLPLGMSDSGFNLSPGMQKKHSAGHLDGEVQALPPLRDTPALGFHTSAQDMSWLLRALLRAEVPGISPAVLNSMWQPQVKWETSRLQNKAGLGWFVEDHSEFGRVVRHGGSTRYFGAEIALMPDMELGVVVLTNGSGSNMLARELAGAILSLAASSKDGVIKQTLAKAEASEGKSIPMASGGYATSLGLLLVDDDRSRLCACIIERILDLTRFEDGSFGLSQKSAASLPESYRILGDLKFTTREQAGEALLVASYEEEEVVLGKRIEDPGLDEAWSQRLGSFQVINPDGDFQLEGLRLSEQGGVLCLHYKAPGLSDSEVRLPLQPISDRAALIQGVERGAGETVEIVEVDGQACLKFSGFIGMPSPDE